jgi:hypothetical protein
VLGFETDTNYQLKYLEIRSNSRLPISNRIVICLEGLWRERSSEYCTFFGAGLHCFFGDSYADVTNAFTTDRLYYSHPNSSHCHRIIFVFSMVMVFFYRDKRIPVTTASSVLGLRMEERPPIWRVAANILNKQSRAADKGWPSSLGWARFFLRTVYKESLGPGMILWYDLGSG